MRSLTALYLVLAASPALAQEASSSLPADQQNRTAAVDQAAEAARDDDLNAAGGEILVVATRISGQIDAPQAPIATFDEAEIQSLGATSVADLLTKVSPQTGSGRGRGRGSGGMPLILVNGQRITNFREMRNYPPEAIKRVEILPEEVALRFGSPPDTRVVNLILKDNFSSKRIEASYSLPTRGGFNAWNTEATLLKISKQNRYSVTATAGDTSPLFESERDLIPTTVRTVASDPDPAAYRSLIADSRNFGLNAGWTKGLGKDGMGGQLTLSSEASRTDSRSLSGLDSVLLTDLAGSTALRTLPDPLERRTRTTSISAGTGYNTQIGKWQFSATLDGTHAETETLIDRRNTAAITALTAAALAGTLPITGTLPAFGAAGQDLATNNSERIESLITLNGRPLRLPGGYVATTIKAGLTWIDFDSLDQRSTVGPVSLNRFRVQGGVNLAIPITSRRENFGGAVGDITLNLSANLSDVSDFGAVNDWSAGLTWAPTGKLNFGASYIYNEEAPSISQLGNPLIQSFNVPVYDFSRGETVLVTVSSGGNPLLKRERQRDIKLSANWNLPIKDSNLIVEWFRNRSSDVTSNFPLLTPQIEAAFPGRVVRDGTGRLISIDQRPVTFFSQESSRLRWGFNTSGGIGKQPDANGMMGMSGGAKPGGARPAAAGAAPTAAPRPAGGSGGGGGARGGRGGGGFMGAMLGGGSPPGRWSLGVYHTVQFENLVTVAPGGPVLDLLGGDAIATSGTPRHSLEFNGGVFYKGFGSFFQGTWNAPTTLAASGLPGTSDLRFGSTTSVNLFLFAELSMMPSVTKAAPFLKGANVSLRIENLFDSVQKVTDASGTVPLSYQRDYIDPRGRVISLQLRKSF